jgi:hypothetical protein
MGAVHAVTPDPAHPRSRVVYSALYRALVEVDLCALVRHVSRNDGIVRIGAMVPNPNPEGRKYFMFCPLPFTEDYRPFEFNELNWLVDGDKSSKRLDRRTGDVQETKDVMEDLINSMDLSEAGYVLYA